jgi:hypothetical protein
LKTTDLKRVDFSPRFCENRIWNANRQWKKMYDRNKEIVLPHEFATEKAQMVMIMTGIKLQRVYQELRLQHVLVKNASWLFLGHFRPYLTWATIVLNLARAQNQITNKWYLKLI